MGLLCIILPQRGECWIEKSLKAIKREVVIFTDFLFFSIQVVQLIFYSVFFSIVLDNC